MGSSSEFREKIFRKGRGIASLLLLASESGQGVPDAKQSHCWRRCTETLQQLAKALPRYVARYAPGFLEEVAIFLPPTSGNLWSGRKKRAPCNPSLGGPVVDRQSSCNLLGVGSLEGPGPDRDGSGIPVGSKGPPSTTDAVDAGSSKDATKVRNAHLEPPTSTSKASVCNADLPLSAAEVSSGKRCGDAVAEAASTDEWIEDLKPKKPARPAVIFAQHPVFLHFYDKRLEKEYRRYFASQAAQVCAPLLRILGAGCARALGPRCLSIADKGL